jgi:hypothetical protein
MTGWRRVLSLEVIEQNHRIWHPSPPLVHLGTSERPRTSWASRFASATSSALASMYETWCPSAAVAVRLRMHPPTRAYMARRLAEGKTKKEVMRCLKRYVVREVFTTIRDRPTMPLGAASAA